MAQALYLTASIITALLRYTVPRHIPQAAVAITCRSLCPRQNADIPNALYSRLPSCHISILHRTVTCYMRSPLFALICKFNVKISKMQFLRERGCVMFLPSEHGSSTDIKQTVSITLTAPYIRATICRTSRVQRKTLEGNEGRSNTSAIARINLHSVSGLPKYKFYYL